MFFEPNQTKLIPNRINFFWKTKPKANRDKKIYSAHP